VPHRSSTIVIGLMLVGAGGRSMCRTYLSSRSKTDSSRPASEIIRSFKRWESSARRRASLLSRRRTSSRTRSPQIYSACRWTKGCVNFSRTTIRFYYSGSADAPAVLRAVWIYRKGTAALLQPVPPETWADRRELEEMTTQRDPVIREQAYEALMSRPDQESRELLMRAIRGETEPDSGLRQRILSTAITKSVQFPPEILSYLAVTDPSEEIRWMALDALSTDPAVKETAEMASSDPSEAVRSRANEILAGIKAAARRQQ
jgi:hypothetical protein